MIPCGLVDEPAEETGPSDPIVRGRHVPEGAFIVLWSGGYNVWSDVDTLFAGLEGR